MPAVYESFSYRPGRVINKPRVSNEANKRRRHKECKPSYRREEILYPSKQDAVPGQVARMLTRSSCLLVSCYGFFLVRGSNLDSIARWKEMYRLFSVFVLFFVLTFGRRKCLLVCRKQEVL
jgi:hypothetical protein